MSPRMGLAATGLRRGSAVRVRMHPSTPWSYLHRPNLNRSNRNKVNPSKSSLPSSNNSHPGRRPSRRHRACLLPYLPARPLSLGTPSPSTEAPSSSHNSRPCARTSPRRTNRVSRVRRGTIRAAMRCTTNSSSNRHNKHSSSNSSIRGIGQGSLSRLCRKDSRTLVSKVREFRRVEVGRFECLLAATIAFVLVFLPFAVCIVA
jgi:hypothetical protein